jgi:Ca2+-binding RTX toxin-like protein
MVLRLRLVLVGLGAAVALAAPAAVAQAGVVTSGPNGGIASEVGFKDTAGEPNALKITKVKKKLVVKDSAAELTAGTGCVAQSAHMAVCKGAESIRLTLGEGDDTARFGSTVNSYATMNGGPGDDVLYGTKTLDNLHGGGGTDKLYGLGSNDILEDNDGPSDTAPDTIDGGRGNDVAYYKDHNDGIDVDLTKGVAAGDAIKDVEAIESGAGDDTLTGSDGDDDLTGGAGHDVLTGLGGDDALYVGGGGRADGGAGNDTITVAGPDASTTTVACGAGGQDYVTSRAADQLGTDCEYADAGNLQVATAYKVKSGKVRFEAYCLRQNTCRGSLVIRGADGTVVATSARYGVVPESETSDSVTFVLDDALTAALASGATYTVAAEDGKGAGYTTTVST